MLAAAMASPSGPKPYARVVVLRLPDLPAREMEKIAWVSLSGKEIVELAKLLSSTLSILDLELYVQESTGDRLFVELVAPGRPALPNDCRIAQQRSKIMGRRRFSLPILCKPAGTAGRSRPQSARSFPTQSRPPGRKLNSRAQTAGAPQADRPDQCGRAWIFSATSGPISLTSTLKRWQARLDQDRAQVCRVEQEAIPSVPAFWSAPTAVLTDWHVFEAAKNAGKADAAGLPLRLFRFRMERCSPDNCSSAPPAVLRFLPV